MRNCPAMLAGFLALLSAASGPAVGAEALRPDWCKLDDPANRGACPFPAPPSRLPDEMVLPLACGQAIVLRKVVVPAQTLLDHQRVTFGDAPVEPNLAGVNRGLRQGNLAGSFTQGFGERAAAAADLTAISGRSYYIGKYELLEHQYRMFMAPAGETLKEPDCAAVEAATSALAGGAEVSPARGLSWYDAVAWTRAVNRWLMAREQRLQKAGQPGVLPVDLDALPALRLPTEEEWEYAARGGSLVPKGLGDGPLPPVRDTATGEVRVGTLEEVAAILGQNSLPGAEFQPAGLTLPNLLGLHDVLGGVEEVTLDLYRLVRPDGSMHGQVGGYVLRGGHAQSPANTLGIGQRTEVPLITRSGEARQPLGGMRPVLALPAWPGTGPDGQAAPGFKAWETAIQKAARDSTQAEAVSPDLAKARQNIADALRADQSSSDTQARLRQAEVDLTRATAQLNDAASRLWRERLRTAVLLAFNVEGTGRTLTTNLASFEEMRFKLERSKAPVAEREQAMHQVAELVSRNIAEQRSLTATFDAYVATVADLSAAPSQNVDAAMNGLLAEFKAQDLQNLASVAALVRRHLREAATSPGSIPATLREKWLLEIDFSRPDRDSYMRKTRR